MTDLAHLTGEVEAVSRAYAERHGIERDDAWFLLKLHEEVGELTQAFLSRSGQARDRGLDAPELDARYRAELADVLGHVLLLAHHSEVDLEAEVRAKWLRWL